MTRQNKDSWDKYQYLRYRDDTTPMAKWRGTKEPLDEGERREWKSWLEAQHLKNKDNGIQSITSWQVEGGKVEAVMDFIFLGSKITVDGTVAMKLEDACFLEGKLWQI